MLEISDSFEVLGLDRGRLTWKPEWIPEVTSRPMENAENDHVTYFGRKIFIHIVNKWRTFSMSTSSIWTQQRTRKNLRGVRQILGIMRWRPKSWHEYAWRWCRWGHRNTRLLPRCLVPSWNLFCVWWVKVIQKLYCDATVDENFEVYGNSAERQRAVFKYFSRF